MVVKQPKFTRVEEPTLLCNQVKSADFHSVIFAVRASSQSNLDSSRNHALGRMAVQQAEPDR